MSDTCRACRCVRGISFNRAVNKKKKSAPRNSDGHSIADVVDGETTKISDRDDRTAASYKAVSRYAPTIMDTPSK